MANNRASSLVLVCEKCGQRYQAITAAFARMKHCSCGGSLREEEPKREEAKIA